jgi:hypothetical protein
MTPAGDRCGCVVSFSFVPFGLADRAVSVCVIRLRAWQCVPRQSLSVFSDTSSLRILPVLLFNSFQSVFRFPNTIAARFRGQPAKKRLPPGPPPQSPSPAA